MKDHKTYLAMAEVLEYPDERILEKVELCYGLLKEHYPDGAEPFSHLRDFVKTADLHRLQEIYTRTFHIQAICYLDLGYVMFGEDYKRGEFLVNMKSEMDRAGIDCGVELADNLMNILKLMIVHSDKEFIEELTTKVTIPSIKQMLAEFDISRIALKQKVLKKMHRALIQADEKNINIYHHFLNSLLEVILADLPAQLQEEAKPDPLLAGLNHLYCNGCPPASSGSFLGSKN